MTELDDLSKMLERMDAKAAIYSNLNAYAVGRQPLSFVAPDVREALNNRLTQIALGIPKLLVESLVERLRIIGFDRPDVWAHWKRNDLDQLAPVCHRESLILGDAYAIVWARPDGSPLVSIESPMQMVSEVDPATRELVRAAKRWEDSRGTHAVVYGPDEIVRWTSPTTGSPTTGFRVVERIPNPLGVPPVVRFRNGGRLLDDGVSEIEDVISLTDAATKLTVDMLTASEYGARPRRWATGLELIELDDGTAVSPIAEDDRMMTSESPETKFGQLPGADLAAYERGIGVVMRQISAVSGLPPHVLGVAGDANPTSADSIRASEAALTAKAEAKQTSLGRSWEAVARLMVAVNDGVDPASVEVSVRWADPSTRSVAQEADAAVKLVTAGILPASWALRRLGYSEAEVAEIRDAKRAEALDGAGVDLAGLLS